MKYKTLLKECKEELLFNCLVLYVGSSIMRDIIKDDCEYQKQMTFIIGGSIIITILIMIILYRWGLLN